MVQWSRVDCGMGSISSTRSLGRITACSTPAPPKPTELRVTFNPTCGAPMLTWKTSNPRGSAGTSDMVRRCISTTDHLEYVGVTRSKHFSDNASFARPDCAQFAILGQRSVSAGAVSEVLIVYFGHLGRGGGLSSSGISSKETKPIEPAAYEHVKLLSTIVQPGAL